MTAEKPPLATPRGLVPLTITNENPNALILPQQSPDWNQMMKQRSQQRRDKQDTLVGELKVQLARLQAALQAETKRRVLAQQEHQKETERKIQKLKEEWSKQVKEYETLQQERMADLEQRVQALEENWKHDVEKVQHQVAMETQQLNIKLEELKESAAQERQDQIQREDRLERQMQEVQKEFDDRWNQERQDRLQVVQTLEDKLNWQDSHVSEQVTTLEGRLRHELAQLQRELAQEVADRQSHDDEIARSLQQYTEHLQHSLDLVSGES